MKSPFPVHATPDLGQGTKMSFFSLPHFSRLPRTSDPRPNWHRPNPNKPTYTITVVLDGKARPVKQEGK